MKLAEGVQTLASGIAEGQKRDPLREILEGSSGTTLSLGADLDVNGAATQHLAVTSLDTKNAVVCYTDEGDSGHGTCNAVVANVPSPPPPSPPPPSPPPPTPANPLLGIPSGAYAHFRQGGWVLGQKDCGHY